ncbi:hypothetical protein SMICM304S_03988 [Streptomyces microflavus]
MAISRAAAIAVSTIDASSQASPSTPICAPVAKPRTGTAIPTTAYPRQILCRKAAVRMSWSCGPSLPGAGGLA